MKSLTLTRTIAAPLPRVFTAIADIRNFQDAVPRIQEVVFLTDQEQGVGTRFRETRLFRGRPAVTELQVTEYVPDQHIRLVSESLGTQWDSRFSVRSVEGGTELTLEMQAHARNVFAGLLNRMVGGMVAEALAGDLEQVQAWCESQP